MHRSDQLGLAGSDQWTSRAWEDVDFWLSSRYDATRTTKGTSDLHTDDTGAPGRTSESLEELIAGRALAYVLDPPRSDDPVIDLASPEELRSLFQEATALAFDDDALAQDDESLLAAVDLVIERSVHTSHPRFVNQNFAGPDPLSVVGDWLASALNTTGATFEAAPVFTLMESAVLSKLGRIVGYVDSGDDPIPHLPPGMFCPGGSSGMLYALQLARHRMRPDLLRTGGTGERMTVFVSESGHYATTKCAAVMGIGTDAVVTVAADDDGAIIPAALDAAIRKSLTAGEVPFAVVATSGTTVTAGFDDLDALADITRDHGLWLHVDGCYGASALFSPTHAHLLQGVERSDSVVWNLHKMMGMTQQCTALLVHEPELLEPCFALQADYLFQPDKLHVEYDSGDRTFQCARRVDVLKLWLAWKHHGDAGFAARIDHAVAMAEHARARIAASKGEFMPVAGTFTNVVFGWVPPTMRPQSLTPEAIRALDPDVRAELHALAPKIKARMQIEGTAMVGFQPIDGLNTFRLLFMNPAVTTSDVDAMLDRISEYGHDIITR
ncbi:MAG: pyridoxal-dependent decarboxylase [Ornithinimicrobium sp.]